VKKTGLFGTNVFFDRKRRVPNTDMLRAFASHDWGRNGANHARVAKVVFELRKCGVHVWFDDTHMKGNIMDAMCRGIEESDVVLVFVTRNYMTKVERGDDTDNVRREFMFASATPQKFVPIRFDPELPRTWTGPLRMMLGFSLYVDLSGEIGERGITQLLTAMKHVVPQTTWRTAVARTAKPKSSSSSSSPPKPTTRALRVRVQRLREAVGDAEEEDGHMGTVVHRLALTLLGTMARDLPIVEKVARMERELGLAA